MVSNPIRVLWIFALVFALAPALAAGQDLSAPQPIRAWFANPTDRYPHNIMGSLSAHTDLIAELGPCTGCSEGYQVLAIRLPESLVFEDFAPRLADMNGDGRNEIVVVESDQERGSRLAVWDVIMVGDEPGLVRGATTDYIGTRFRWLAPIGAADFDGDGAVEFAYVEKPHLDKVLRVVRRDGKLLRLVASVQGVTNHAIGQEKVHSRIETCPDGTTIYALDGSGEGILSIHWDGATANVRAIGKADVRHQLDERTFCRQ